MRPRRMTRAAVFAIAAGAAALALGGGAPRTPPARAQADPLVYVLRSTWRGQDVPVPYQRLPWPAGHQAGGLGHDPHTGVLYATDLTDGSIRSFDAARLPGPVIGGPGTPLGPLASPRDVAVVGGAAGDVVVTEPGAGRARLVGADGTVRAAIALVDPQGAAPAPPLDVHGAAVYVLDRAGLRIVGLDEQGRVRLDEPVGPPFVMPEGLAVEQPFAGGAPQAQTTAIVADPGLGEARVLQLLPGAAVATSRVGQPLEGVRAVARAWGVGAAGAGIRRTLVGAPGAGVVWTDAPDQRQAGVPFADVRDIEITVGGDVFAAVDPDGVVALGPLTVLLDRLTWPAGRLTDPARIAVGDAAVIADGAPRVQVWDRAGTPRARVLSPNGVPLVDVAASGSRAFALAADTVGTPATVWALDGGAFGASWRPAADGTPRQPVAIAAFGDRVAVLDLLAQEVVVLDGALGEVARWSVAPAGAFEGVLDIALGAGRAFIANPQAGALEVWTDAGVRLATVPIPTGPLRVAAGPGDVAFVLTASKWVFAYGPGGEPLGAWPAGQPGDRPVDLAVDAAGDLYVADATGVVRVYARDDAAPAQLPPASGPGRCAVVRDKGAAPPEIMLGDSVEVRLVVDGACPVDHQKADVVLTIDKSGSMQADNKIGAARQAATAFLAQTDPLFTRIALVGFDIAATVIQPLTSDRRRLIEQINTLEASGGTHLVHALDASLDVLTGPDARPGVAKVVVYMSDGRHTELGNVPIADPPGLAEAIARARAAGIHVFTIGLGRDADVDNLRRMATDEASYFFSPTPGELHDIYVHIARRIEAAELFEAAVVTDRVPANMTFLPGTGRPVEPDVSPDGRTLTWRLAGVREPGFRLAYRLRPEEAGYWPTNVEAFTDYVDGFGNRGNVVFPIPFVRVLAPTPTPGPPPSPTPVPPPRIYLPLLVKQACAAFRMNVVLVVDTSSSMGGPLGPDGMPKLDAARAAVRAFLDGTDLRRDRVALARFDASAAVVAAGRDAAALRRALDGLVLHEGTRIDLGLAAARAHLAGAGRLDAARPVVVLLSDGSPSAGTAEAARAAARGLAADGATLYTVAVGTDADRPFLAELAASPARALRADDPGALVRLYAALAAGLDPCTPPWSAEAGP